MWLICCPSTICWKNFPFSYCFEVPFQLYIKGWYMKRFISGLLILFYWFLLCCIHSLQYSVFKKSFNIWYSKSFHLAVVLQELVALLGQLFFHVHFKNSLSVSSPKLKKQTGWAWFDHDSVGHLERISVIILGLLIHEHVICLSLSPFNVLIKFYNHQRDPEHCMYKYIYSFLCKSYI